MRIHYIKIFLQGIFLWLFFVLKVSVYLCPYLRPYYHESVKRDFPFISWNGKNIEYLTRNICYGYDHNLFPVWTFSQAKRHCDENLSFLTGNFSLLDGYISFVGTTGLLWIMNLCGNCLNWWLGPFASPCSVISMLVRYLPYRDFLLFCYPFLHKFFFCIYLLKYLKYPDKLKDLLLVLTLKQTLF